MPIIPCFSGLWNSGIFFCLNEKLARRKRFIKCFVINGNLQVFKDIFRAFLNFKLIWLKLGTGEIGQCVLCFVGCPPLLRLTLEFWTSHEF